MLASSKGMLEKEFWMDEVKAPVPMNRDKKQSAPLGRPKDQEKRLAILEAARTHFFERGFDAVTIEGIAATAGVSKMTVYGHFNDKNTLFKVFVEREIVEMSNLLAQLPLTFEDLRQTLIQFGMVFLDFITRPEVIRFNRLMISVAPQHPQLVGQFFEAGPTTIYTALAGLLRQATTAQLLVIPHPDRAADQLIAMWQSFEFVKVQLGLKQTLLPQERLDYVQDCVDTLLRAWQRDWE
jgi:TetR/AcrR family transcriptional repressor of mexJK operon